MVQLGPVVARRAPRSGRLAVCRNWILRRWRAAVAVAGLSAAQGLRVGVRYRADDVVRWTHPHKMAGNLPVSGGLAAAVQ